MTRHSNSVKQRKKIFPAVIIILCLLIIMFALSEKALTSIGQFLIVDEDPVRSDAVVVLNTGIEYYPRLIEAAKLYRQGFSKRVIINGNRKSDTLRELEAKGFKTCCPWYEDRLRILELMGVPRKDVEAMSAEDSYDTVSEARAVGDEIAGKRMSGIIIVTSKSHTRRARFIWKKLYSGELKICTVAAESDPFIPDGWWKKGRQIRWVLAEYGAWVYYFWKRITL